MRVIVSVGGRFHAFHLAEQLARHGALVRLITAYPRSFAVKAGVPKDKISSAPLKEMLERAWRKLPGPLRDRINPQPFLSDMFDRSARRRLLPADIFVGWSSFSLGAMRRAKAMGMRAVIDHGSSHIVAQRDLLIEEYERWGLRPGPFELPHPRIVEKEMLEYAEADAIAIPSNFVRRTFLAHGVAPEKLMQVPYGVDLSMFRPAPKRDKVFRIIFRSNLTLRKGILYLLKAFSELRLKDAELVAIGTIDPAIEHLLTPYAGIFRHIPNQPMSSLAQYYSEGSVFILPSLEEGLAMVQPQAMACGLPMIVTTNTGGEDIIRDGKDGFIIPIRDTDALKEKIIYLYEHPEERAAMGVSARERVSSGFAWTDYGDRMVAAYDRLLGRS